jgi:hypothetical protein
MKEKEGTISKLSINKKNGCCDIHIVEETDEIASDKCCSSKEE